MDGLLNELLDRGSEESGGPQAGESATSISHLEVIDVVKSWDVLRF